MSSVSRFPGGLVKPLGQFSIANANENDVTMTVEDLESAFAAPGFAGRDLVTV